MSKSQNPYHQIAQTLYRGLVAQLKTDDAAQVDGLHCVAMKVDDIVSSLIGVECRDALLSYPRDLVSKNRRALIATVRSMIQGRQRFMTNFVSPNQEVNAGPVSQGFFVVSVSYDVTILQFMALVWPEFLPLWSQLKALLPDQCGAHNFMEAYHLKTGTAFSQSQATKFFI